MNSLVLRFVLISTLTLCAVAARADDTAADPETDRRDVVLVLGDSLSAAYGVPADQGWVALLQKRLERAGYPAHVINASVSGETTAGGLARLPALLERHRPAWVLVELGGNDGLRGLPLRRMQANLSRMVELSRGAGARPVLFEMRIPTNYGADYANGFTQTFATVAQKADVPLVPFILGAIATDPDAFQEDGIHPTVGAQEKLLDAAWPTLHSVMTGNASGRVPHP